MRSKKANKRTDPKIYEDVVIRSCGRCELCGMRAGQMHHVFGLGMGGTTNEKRLNSVIHICIECHRGIHDGGLPDYQQYILDIWKRYYERVFGC